MTDADAIAFILDDAREREPSPTAAEMLAAPLATDVEGPE